MIFKSFLYLSFSNSAVQNRGNQGGEAQRPARQGLVPRRSNRIRRGQGQTPQDDYNPVSVARTNIPQPPVASHRRRIFADFPDFGDHDYRPGRETPQQPSVQRVREIMNESDRDQGQNRGESFLERLSEFRSNAFRSSWARITARPDPPRQRYSPWGNGGRPNRAPTPRRARIQAAQVELDGEPPVAENHRLPAFQYMEDMNDFRERIGQASLPSYNAWIAGMGLRLVICSIVYLSLF